MGYYKINGSWMKNRGARRNDGDEKEDKVEAEAPPSCPREAKPSGSSHDFYFLLYYGKRS